MTQAQIASALDAHQTSVSEWVRDLSMPTVDRLMALPELLGVNGHWLLTGKGQIDPPSKQPDLEAVRREAVAHAALTIERSVQAALKSAADELAGELPRPTAAQLKSATAAAKAASQPVKKGTRSQRKAAG